MSLHSDEKITPSAAEKAGPAFIDNQNYNEATTNAFGQKEGEKLSHDALLPRHIAMISIGGVIGTGLFIGTGNSLSNGGPVGLWLGYMTMATVCYSMMQPLGVMVSWLPLPGGHITLAERFISPSMSLAMGWLYFANWTIVLPAEVSAAAVLIAYWSPDTSPAIWMTLALVVIIGINLLGTRAFGEAEFWFASIKILTIVGLIIMSFALDVGAGDEGVLGFRYWKNPGPFVQYNGVTGSLGRFLGYWSVLINSAFSFIGTEICAIAAGEAKNPRKTLPKAISRVWVRILFFYILGTLAISVICPSNEPDLSLGSKTTRSPFVIAIRLAGIKTLPSIVNACFVTSAVSAGSSDLYTSSRALYGLAIAGQAPRIFAKTTKGGLPIVALAVGIAFSSLSYMSVSEGGGKVFGWFANLTSICGMITWTAIGVIYIRFHKAMVVQNFDQSQLPFKHKGAIYMAWYVVIWTSLIMLFSGFHVFLAGNWDLATFITSYLPLPLFFLILGIAWWRDGCKAWVRAEDADLYSGVQEIIDAEVEEPPPKNLWDKIWAKI